MSTKNKESLLNALDLLEKERGIPRAYMLEKIEAALISAYHKEYGANARVRIFVDTEKDDIKVFRQMTVVAEVTDPENELTVEQAQTYNKL